MKKLVRPAVAAGLVTAAALFASPSQAHHAFAAEFDAAKPVVLQGAVNKVRFVNPHSWIYVDVKAKDGTVSTWGFEFGTPKLTAQQRPDPRGCRAPGRPSPSRASAPRTAGCSAMPCK